MSFIDDLKERKERNEARNYFRQNNDQIPNTIDFVKTVVLATSIGSLIGILCQIVNFYTSYIYLLVAWLIAQAINVFVRKSTFSIKITASVCYIVGIYIGGLLYFVSLVGVPTIMSIAVVVFGHLFLQNLLSTLFLFVSAYCLFVSIR